MASTNKSAQQVVVISKIICYVFHFSTLRGFAEKDRVVGVQRNAHTCRYKSSKGMGDIACNILCVRAEIACWADFQGDIFVDQQIESLLRVLQKLCHGQSDLRLVFG